ncbi:MAG: hydroxymethylbilane synthase [Verrucomicrobiota bacterium]
MESITLATRGSDLALTQTRMVASALQEAHPALVVDELVIKTSGDLRQDLKLSEFAQGENPVVDKGIFTKELEHALLEHRAHAAVHSLKDVPTLLEESFTIAAVLPRAPVADVALFKPGGPSSLSDLPPDAKVGTSSVRRQRFLHALHPHLDVVDVRGNVPTRIRKLLDLNFDAILLAGAGLARLYGEGCLETGRLDFDGRVIPLETLDPEVFLPAASQGAVAIEILSENEEAKSLCHGINHPPTFRQIMAERAFLDALSAGCDTPVGALSKIDADGRLHLKVAVFENNDSTTPLRAEGSCVEGGETELGQRLFHDLSA